MITLGLQIMLGWPKWAQIDNYIQIFSIDISMIQIYSVRIVFLIYLDICLSIQMPHSVWTKHMQFTELDHKLLWDDQNSKKKSTKSYQLNSCLQAMQCNARWRSLPLSDQVTRRQICAKSEIAIARSFRITENFKAKQSLSS